MSFRVRLGLLAMRRASRYCSAAGIRTAARLLPEVHRVLARPDQREAGASTSGHSYPLDPTLAGLQYAGLLHRMSPHQCMRQTSDTSPSAEHPSWSARLRCASVTFGIPRSSSLTSP
jgi:hypothetical protein